MTLREDTGTPLAIGLNALFVMATSLMALACGGESTSGGSCTEPASACGGDVVGIWKVTSSCVTPGASRSVDTCPGATYGIESVTVTGTLEFRADGTEISTGSLSERATYHFPQSCLKQACADTAQVLSSSTMGNGQTASGASCSVSGSTCNCGLTIQGTVQDTDTYTASGGTLTTTSGKDGSVLSQSYCVQGTELAQWGDHIVFHAEKQ